jgi:spore coat polysaccharide biosynthesis protein SpsF
MTTACDVLIRCDGDGATGLGHVKRCLALARALERAGLAVAFTGTYDASASALIAAAHASILPWDGQRDEAGFLSECILRTQARALVLDIRTSLSKEAVAHVRARGIATLAVDDLSERRLAADLVALPPTAEAERAAWPGFSGEKLIGWRWTILSGPVTHARPDLASHGVPPLKLLVTMGGADPSRLTERVALALLPLKARLAPSFVIGPAFAEAAARAEALRKLWPDAEIVLKPASLGPVIQHMDLALVAYGVTAQELAAAGVPALYLGLTSDHEQGAHALAATGAGLSLGRHDTVGDESIARALAALIDNPAQRRAMAEAGPRAIDGLGALRLAEKLVARLAR